MMKKKVVFAIGGSSGARYAFLLMKRLKEVSDQWDKVGLVMSGNAKLNWELEVKEASYDSFGFDIYEQNDFFAPFASGSAKYDTMIVCPCSMGLLARIRSGFSNDLITRAADVILKERRKLILVPREAPYSTLHLENMHRLSEYGAIICPATPSFYHGQEDLDAVLYSVVDRVLDLAGFEINTQRWNEE
jgi:4-hydroxy-3-polyprenylbenzoate decarboxylase